MRAEHLIRRIHCLSALHHHAANIQTFLILPNFFKFLCPAVSPVGQRDRRDTLVRLLRECLYHPLQYPCECCPFLKNFSYICRVKRLSRPTLHICESVFRKSLHENVEVFLAKGRTEQHSLSYRYLWTGTFCVPRYPISIRVWGIVSFYL